MKIVASHSGSTLQEESLPSLPLFGSILCVDCERISISHGDCCPVCGSKSVLSIEQILGGTLSGERVRLVEKPMPPHFELARTA